MILVGLLWLLVTLVSLCLIVVARELWKIDRSMSRFPKIPGHPVWKNYAEFSSYETLIAACSNAQKNYGDKVRIDIFLGMCGLLITDLKLLEFLLSTSHVLSKSFNYKYFHRWLGMGLLTSTGEKWKKSRKLLTPTFHFQILEQYVEVYSSASDILIKKLRQEVNKGPFNVYPYITLYTLDVICETAMGTKVNAQENSKSQYVSSVRDICQIITDRTVTPSKVFDVCYVFTADYWKERRCVKVLHDYTESVIRSKKEALRSQSGDDVETKTKRRRLAFLDLLLQCNADGLVLTDEEIREEVDTFLFEGHDTTSSGISFTLYCLATNPEVQQKALEELRHIFGNDRSRPASFQDLQEMTYLEMVIKEALRLYPPVPFYMRESETDVPYDDGVLPRRAQMIVFAFGVHRDPNNYPDPEKFDPERFTLENQASRSPFSYLTFSAGPRNCIGQRFAMLELKSTISNVLRNFELFPVDGYVPQLAPLIVLKSLNGIQIQLKERKYFLALSFLLQKITFLLSITFS